MNWKIFKGWRTWIFNALALVPLLFEFAAEFLITSQEFGISQFLPDDWQKWYALAIIIVNMYLRKVTTTPLGKKE